MQKLSREAYFKISQFIEAESGIKIPESRMLLIESRLRKRLIELNLDSFEEYAELVFSNSGGETEKIGMIDSITTNKTDFFRDREQHFFLSQFILPKHIEGREKKKLEIWSAGCSSGQEPYSIAMTLEKYSRDVFPLSYIIYGTDISYSSLLKAYKGFYRAEEVKAIHSEMKDSFLECGRQGSIRGYRICQDICNNICFNYVNLMEQDYPLPSGFDVIFYRNVSIYFSETNRRKILSRICSYLKGGGYLMVGYSENLDTENIPLKRISPTIYRKE